MYFHKAILLAVFALPTFAALCSYGKSSIDKNAACPSAHIFCVRATTELPGCGASQGLVDLIEAHIPGSDCEAIVYPADGIDAVSGGANFGVYKRSEAEGTDALQSAMKDFYERCPETPTALIGYSQGAQVVGDVLCGRDMALFDKTDPIDPKYVAQARAIVQFGDPSNRKNVLIPWHKGNDSVLIGGVFPRREAALDYCKSQGYGSKWQSWCDQASNGRNDFFCGSGLCDIRKFPNCTAVKIHLQYIINHGDEVADWVTQKLLDQAVAEQSDIDMEL